MVSRERAAESVGVLLPRRVSADVYLGAWGDGEMVSVEALVDEVLRRKAEKGREIVGGMRFRASELGYCLKAQMLSALGHESQKQFDDRTLRVFEVGHQTARTFEAWFREAGVLVEPPDGLDEWEMHDAEWNLGAHVDFILRPGIGIELKSKHSKSWWWARKKGEPVASDHQLVQAAAYSLLADKTQFRPEGLEVKDWRVVVVSKDDLMIAEEPVTEAHRTIALDRILTLNKHLAAGSLPACTCATDWGGKYAQYCKFWNGSGCCELVAS